MAMMPRPRKSGWVPAIQTLLVYGSELSQRGELRLQLLICWGATPSGPEGHSLEQLGHSVNSPQQSWNSKVHENNCCLRRLWDEFSGCCCFGKQ